MFRPAFSKLQAVVGARGAVSSTVRNRPGAGGLSQQVGGVLGSGCSLGVVNKNAAVDLDTFLDFRA